MKANVQTGKVTFATTRGYVRISLMVPPNAIVLKIPTEKDVNFFQTTTKSERSHRHFQIWMEKMVRPDEVI